jgi:putative ABC transport system permease protein
MWKSSIKESIEQAVSQIRSNKLRSILSLLGISIGIFCIIMVRSAVDSLEATIKNSFQKLGNDVVYISKMPWGEDPSMSYWKYMRRPVPNYDDFNTINEKVKSASLVSFGLYGGNKTAKFFNNTIESAPIFAVTYDYGEMFSLPYSEGRYFTQSEFDQGAFVAILGGKVAEQLFGAISPLGKTISLNGYKLKVIGVLKTEGKSLIQINNHDNIIFLSFKLGQQVAKIKPNNKFGFNSFLGVKVKQGYTADELKDEITGELRSKRRLKPLEENNWAMNELSILSKFLDGFLNVLNIAGGFIALFSLLVGMFSVANIMFVSVKERTNIIGIKKALGAKRMVILVEFLIESILLCLIGGVIGLVFVGILTFLINSSGAGFEFVLSLKNIILGLVVSILIGVISGFIPANQASKLDPVEAMRR